MCRDTPDKKYLHEFYPMIKQNMIYTVNLRTTPEYSVGERIIAMPDKNEGSEWFECAEPGWCGMTAHIGDLHIAQLRIAERMAREVGDTDFANQCATWIEAARDAMEKRLWTGSITSTTSSLRPAGSRTSSLATNSMANGSRTIMLCPGQCQGSC